jgi:hypothetical protein
MSIPQTSRLIDRPSSFSVAVGRNASEISALLIGSASPYLVGGDGDHFTHYENGKLVAMEDERWCRVGSYFALRRCVPAMHRQELSKSGEALTVAVLYVGCYGHHI